MVVDLAHGQKTGAFLTSGQPRKGRARRRPAGAEPVGYAGGSSTAAALGGAPRRVR
jgi:hypothetical protein